MFRFSLFFCLKHVSFYEELSKILSQMCNTGYSCPILIKREFYGQICEKYSNIKCHENPSSGSRVVLRGQRDSRTDRRAIIKVTVAFRNFANALKKLSNVTLQFYNYKLSNVTLQFYNCKLSNVTLKFYNCKLSNVTLQFYNYKLSNVTLQFYNCKLSNVTLQFYNCKLSNVTLKFYNCKLSNVTLKFYNCKLSNITLQFYNCKLSNVTLQFYNYKIASLGKRRSIINFTHSSSPLLQPQVTYGAHGEIMTCDTV
jgi:type VI protein secretion system component Hcp